MTTAKKAKKETGPHAGEARLRIRVRAYENKVLDASVRQIMDTALRFDAKMVGPVPLPTEIKFILCYKTIEITKFTSNLQK